MVEIRGDEDPIEANKLRAERAGQAVTAYQRTDGEFYLRDLLCDLRHWAMTNSVSFDEESEWGGKLFADELEDAEAEAKLRRETDALRSAPARKRSR